MRRRKAEHDAARRKRFVREQKAHERKRRQFARVARHGEPDDEPDPLPWRFEDEAERE